MKVLDAGTVRRIASSLTVFGLAACVVLGTADGATAGQRTVAQLVTAAAQHAPVRRALGLPVRSSIDPRFARALESDSLPVIYISNNSTPGSVVAYPANMMTLPAVPLETIGNLNQPGALAVDEHGNLYVSEFGTNLIKVFAPGSTSPSRVLTVPLIGQGLRDLLVDGRGNVYVTMASFTHPGGAVVMVFVKGATSPSYTLSDPSIIEAFNLAVDARGNVFLLYLGSSGIGVGVFPAATTLGPASLSFNFFHRLNIDVGANSPSVNSIAIDKNGDLLVLDATSVISVYPPDSQTTAIAFTILPSRVFPVLRLTGPHNRHLFVPTLGSNVFDEYAYPSGTHEAQFALPATFIGGLAVSPMPPQGTW